MKNGSTGHKDWRFDEHIAPSFVEHARQHIPNYETVTDKCARYCALNVNKDAKIIDVGCATGHTLKKLHAQGFTNLYGLDNSPHMIEFAPKGIASYFLSDTFLGDDYDMILCNWTLHFIKDKEKYLKAMADGLKNGGTMILSEKTSKDTDLIKMFINSAEWYQQKLLSLGFTVTVMDADWCFTTFLCKK